MAQHQQYHLLSGYIASIYRQSKSEFKRRIAIPTCSGTQSDLLVFLYDHPGLCQRQIAEFMGVDPSLLARDIKALVGQGLVDCRPNPADRRAKIVALTGQGAKLAKDRIRDINAWWADFFQHEPGLDPKSLYQGLVSVSRHLQTEAS
ncbi:MarR family winged helix-turn-helix transcriptional regulator [Bifidobacterium xylocopae]|uniref:Transcriptional regulator n=1 Tax=Bifidobacterium xylocopae TaxID=2493119 RepID=A0A366KEA6_9BIFI|nr:MarR family transcriptional regulator [Bifidobacterium xylocopae]RBP99538.1 transcriptional regulator [Bifidobacterium xylocopae]